MSSTGRIGLAAAVATAAALLLAVPGPGLAQEAPAFGTIRATSFTGTDRTITKRWIDQQIKALLAADDPLELGRQLFFTPPGGLVPNFQAANATAPFRDGLAELLAEAFLREYQAADPAQTRPSAITYPLIVLKIFKQPSALPCFQQALTDPAPAVRGLAAQGIGVIRDRIENAQWDALLPDLQKAGIAETNVDVLSNLYRALRVNAPARIDRVRPVILAILDDRLARFEQKGKLPSPADAETLAWLSTKTNDATTPRNSLVRRTARLLANAVYAYLLMKPPAAELLIDPTDPAATLSERLQTFFGLAAGPQTVNPTANDSPEQVAEKLEQFLESVSRVFHPSRLQLERLERVIQTCESALGTMVSQKPQPKIAEPLLKNRGPDQAEKMAAELSKWIGTSRQEGLLNAAPFSFERGLALKRAIPIRKTTANP